MPSTRWSDADLRAIIAQYWGYQTLRPLQEEAMRAALDDRDSLVVMPTGGGKSLCYQAPAVLRGGTTVVISPLIALMKDQVDSLRACGIAAAQIDSSLTAAERFVHEMNLRQGAVQVLFVSPERLVLEHFYRKLQEIDVRAFAIDEAHCISHWGHDFRPEYRQLSEIRQYFPRVAFHAYTATATEQVRKDIISQLALVDPVVLVGSFDRANLTYRVLPRHDVLKQTLEVIERHDREAGIIYCLRRRDVDDLADSLHKKGIKALAYHAGMTSEQRQTVQEAFAREECDIVVATVAFGMGIDRSNVRFVLHTAMPKSLEHYQQETGRAGRDGLGAECVLLYSGADVFTFKAIIEKSAAEAEVKPEPAVISSAFRHLDDMDRYCRGAVCRHRALVQYFGQTYDRPTCGACDLCLGDTEEVPDALVVAQKILSCVARVKQTFGVGHVVSVLRGENTDNVRKRAHDQLTTFGLLKGHSKPDVRDWIFQLIGQGVLLQVGDEYPVLRLNEASWEVMRGERPVRLIQLARRKKGEKPAASQADRDSWEGVDRDLFEALRLLRRDLAGARQVPPYVIFSDTSLREMARIRPSTLEGLRRIYGVGDAKLREYGDAFLERLTSHCRQHSLSFDAPPLPPQPRSEEPARRPNARQQQAFALFAQGEVIEDVMHQMGLARSTVTDYLAEFIRSTRPASISTWIDDLLYQRIAAAARQVGTERLKPIYLLLGEQLSYDDIRLVVAHLQAHAGAE